MWDDTGSSKDVPKVSPKKTGNTKSKKKVSFESDDPSETPIQAREICRQLSFSTAERPKRSKAPTSLKEASLKNKMRQD